MATVSEIFNGDPKSGSNNIPRSAMAFAIPMALGFGGAIIQNLTSPELGIIPPVLTLLAPTALGIIEMFRQFRLTDRKNDEADERLHRSLIEALSEYSNEGTPNIHLYRRRKQK